MLKGIEDPVVVITGASSGVGRACVTAFAQQGARLALLARNQEALEHAACEARAAGGAALALPTDVSDADAVEAAASATEQQFGHIDIWINCAMVTVFSPFTQLTAEEFRRVTEVSYLGYVYGTMSALRRMVPRDEGTIIQIGSALAYRSIPLQSAYCGAKAAIRGFTDSIRTELLHDGSHVRLSMLQLPAVNTPQFVVQRNKLPHRAQPVPPIFEPELIAEHVVWAAEHAPREMVIGGSSLQAIMGQELAPGLLDQYLARTGYDSQQTEEPSHPDRPDNLFEPVPGDHGARGPFSNQAHERSLQMWLRTHPATVAGMLGTGLVGAATLAARRARQALAEAR